MTEAREFTAGPDDAGRRLDRLLRRFLPDMPLSALYAALRKGRIRLNGSRARPDDRLEAGDRLLIDASLLEGALRKIPGDAAASVGEGEPPPESLASELHSLESLLVFAGKDLLFLNKPRGMPSHGPQGLDLLVGKALAARRAASLSFAPGPLHRLDRNSSGLIAFPRSQAGAREFTALLRAGKVRKRYLAFLRGELAAEEPWRDLLRRDRERELTEVLEPYPTGSAAAGFGPGGAPLPAGAAEARSIASPLLRGGGLTLALIEIETGLTHQIRAQAGARGLPLAGDSKYGGGSFRGGYLLHAWLLDLLELPFPDLPSRLEAPLPPEARELLASLFGAEELEKALERARSS